MLGWPPYTTTCGAVDRTQPFDVVIDLILNAAPFIPLRQQGPLVVYLS